MRGRCGNRALRVPGYRLGGGAVLAIMLTAAARRARIPLHCVQNNSSKLWGRGGAQITWSKRSHTNTLSLSPLKESAEEGGEGRRNSSWPSLAVYSLRQHSPLHIGSLYHWKHRRRRQRESERERSERSAERERTSIGNRTRASASQCESGRQRKKSIDPEGGS